ncbi:hypothetical protein M8818_002470 [Zalaria obscura]|uniref:Uncharacterized protein n=1 Tax=Zalaria obscura TaxID=2024903 RepID=A0ACC3SGV9_9PEZI
MSSQILADRDTNTPSQPTSQPNPFVTQGAENKMESKPKSMDFHRQMFENKMKADNGKEGQSYVSPSDAIMSPASQKLSSFKQRQMNKQMGAPIAKSRSLFATTRAKDLGPAEENARDIVEMGVLRGMDIGWGL